MESLGILTFKVPEENNNIKSHNETPLQKRLKKKKILTIPSVGKDTDQLGLSDIAGGVQNATAILEKNLAGSYKVKHTLTINI